MHAAAEADAAHRPRGAANGYRVRMTTTPPPQARGGASPARARRGLSAKAITAIVIVVLALIFIFSNLSDGSLHFLGFTFTMPVWIWFLVLLVVGIVIGSMFPWLRPKRRNRY